jgi:putative proteasome-type protease
MDSTLRSNLSVGLPLDMLVYKTGALEVTHFSHIDATNVYFDQIHNTWGEKLKEVFSALPNPVWTETSAEEARLVSLRVGNTAETRPTHSIQTLAGQQ